MITYHNGDLLESGCEIIAHQVNLQGIMGGGLARQIADKYPNCEVQYKLINKKYSMAGDVHFFSYGYKGKGRFIANAFSQELDFKTNYDWIKSCFKKIKEFAIKFYVKSIGVPFNYGCGIANGEWSKIESVFKELFESDPSIELQIWKF